MIQKVFNCEVCEPLPEDDIIHVIFSDKNDSAIGFDWSWWNAEYKKPTTKKDLAVASYCKLVDCIDREYTAKYVEEFANNEYVPEEEAETIYLIADGIRHIPTVYPKSDKPIGKWMSVNEALPDEPSESVLVCDIDGDIYKAYLSDYDGWRRSEDFEKVKSVRAWQPLPAPYKGEQE